MSENGRWSLDDGAADAVFERVLAGLEGAAAAEPAANGHAPPKEARVRLTQVRSAAARTLDLYGELFQRAFETYADLAQAALQPGSDPAPGTPLALAGRAGETAAVTLWLHNLSGSPVHDVALVLTDLSAPGGAAIAGAAAGFTPARLELEAGASAPSELRVLIPAGAPPGLYHGHVLAPALPEAALVVRLEVRR